MCVYNEDNPRVVSHVRVLHALILQMRYMIVISHVIPIEFQMSRESGQMICHELFLFFSILSFVCDNRKYRAAVTTTRSSQVEKDFQSISKL